MSDSELSAAASPRKHKKSKKRHEQDDITDEVATKRQRTSSNTSDSLNIDDYWNEDEIGELIEAVAKQIPKGDKIYRLVMPHLDWQNIRVGLHSPESCKKKFDFIISKVRKERSCIEVVNAAKAINTNGRLLEYPDDKPKRPLPGMFHFFTNRIRKIKNKHPDWPFAMIQKQAKEDYKKISEKKKAKLKAKYEQEMVEYQKALTVWLDEHPEFASRNRSFQQAPHITSATLLFVKSKCNKELVDDPTLSRSELRTKFCQKWKTLNDKKKYRYLNKAVKAKIQYDKDIEEYVKSHPDYKPSRPRIGFLTNDEWKIKEKFDGKPELPPHNGFYLFIAENTVQGVDQTELAKRWKHLCDTEKNSYNNRAKQIKEEYPNLLKKFLNKLDEDERKVYEERLQILNVKHTDSEQAEADKKDEYLDGQKNKQINKLQLAQDFPEAPKKPPTSGYQLFCTRLLRETKNIPNKERMAFCAREWKNADQEKYKKTCRKLNKKYTKALEEYLSKLPKDDAAHFLELKSAKAGKISVVHLLGQDRLRTKGSLILGITSSERQVQTSSSLSGVESPSSAFVDIESSNIERSSKTDVKPTFTGSSSHSSSGSGGIDDGDDDDDDNSHDTSSSMEKPFSQSIVKHNNGIMRKPRKGPEQNKNHVTIILKNKRTSSKSSPKAKEQPASSNSRKMRSEPNLTHISYESFSE